MKIAIYLFMKTENILKKIQKKEYFIYNTEFKQEKQNKN